MVSCRQLGPPRRRRVRFAPCRDRPGQRGAVAVLQLPRQSDREANLSDFLAARPQLPQLLFFVVAPASSGWIVHRRARAGILLRLLIQGYPGPVIALDAKGSPDLADTVWSLPGHVWELGGPLKLDLLDPEPWGCWYWSVWELACSSAGVCWH